MEQTNVAHSLQKFMETVMRRSMRNFFLFSRERGLSMSQIGALFILRRKGACGVSDIGEELGITTAATSQMLNRLVDQQLIMRSEDPVDRRIKRIELTEQGIQTVKDSIHARQYWLGELAESLSTSEQQQVIFALDLLIEKAKHFDPDIMVDAVA